MAYVLTGTRYIGNGTLPTAIAGYDAVDTSTGNLYASNSTATGWVLIGNINQVNMGLAAITGFTATGAIVGATGWAPVAAPNFTTSAKRDGVDLATTVQLSDTSTSILASIAPKISEAIASLSTAITVKGSIAMAHGVLTFAANTSQTIPLPTYPDGSTAAESDCRWSAGVIAFDNPADSLGNFQLMTSGTLPLSRTFYSVMKNGAGAFRSTWVSYLIIGIKS